MISQLPNDGTSPMRRAIERRIEAGDPNVSRLSEELDILDEAIRAVFTAGMQNVMRMVPGSSAPMAERALHSLILDRVTVALDEELDTADQIRRDG